LYKGSKKPSLLDDWGIWGWIVAIGFILVAQSILSLIFNTQFPDRFISLLMVGVGLILIIIGVMKVTK